MHLIYIDESGNEIIDGEENFVLAAIILNEEKWFEVDKRISELKEKHLTIDSKNEEIHMMDIIGHKKVFNGMPITKRIEIIQEIFEIIKIVDMRIVYVVIKKHWLTTPMDIEDWAYRLLFERLCWQLKDLNEHRQKQEYGLLILDTRGKTKDTRLWFKLNWLLKFGSGYEKNNLMIEGPIFTESHLRALSQLVDCVAYVVNHKYKNQEKKHISLNDCLKSAYQIIDNKMIGENRYKKKIFPSNPPNQ